jgi:hypothetical protein
MNVFRVLSSLIGNQLFEIIANHMEGEDIPVKIVELHGQL